MKRRIQVTLLGEPLTFWEGARVAALLHHLPIEQAQRIQAGQAWVVDRQNNQVALEGPLEPDQAYAVKEAP